MSHIFIVDDEPDVRSMLELFLTDLDHKVDLFTSAEDAWRVLEAHSPDLVLLDISLPGISGLELLERIRQTDTRLPVVMITGHTDPDLVVQSMKLGAYDYIPKPLQLDRLRLIVEHAITQKRLEKERDLLSSRQEKLQPQEMLGESVAFQKVIEMVPRVAASPSATVLIKGETGTGKELLALAIHRHSTRCDEPFLEINCSAMPATLLESELFGYEKGAFTDARKRKIGLIEEASGGTFFLDEIGDMELELQGKLLRVLEQKSIRRVGGTANLNVDVRFIAATHRNLEQMIGAGAFREDLFYRLDVLTLRLPPLRERHRDIILLAEHFIERFNLEYRKHIRGLSPATSEAMLNYNWPGNIRELRNALERAVLIESSEWIEPEHLFLRQGIERQVVEQETEQENGFQIPLDGFSLVEHEKMIISQVLEQARYNVSRAARRLGLSRETLRYRIRKYELE